MSEYIFVTNIFEYSKIFVTLCFGSSRSLSLRCKTAHFRFVVGFWFVCTKFEKMVWIVSTHDWWWWSQWGRQEREPFCIFVYCICCILYFVFWYIVFVVFCILYFRILYLLYFVFVFSYIVFVVFCILYFVFVVFCILFFFHFVFWINPLIGSELSHHTADDNLSEEGKTEGHALYLVFLCFVFCIFWYFVLVFWVFGTKCLTTRLMIISVMKASKRAMATSEATLVIPEHSSRQIEQRWHKMTPGQVPQPTCS